MKKNSFFTVLHLYAMIIGWIIGSLFWKITYIWAENRRVFANLYDKDRVDQLMLDVLNRTEGYLIKVIIAFIILGYITVEIFVYRRHLLRKSLIPDLTIFLPQNKTEDKCKENK